MRGTARVSGERRQGGVAASSYRRQICRPGSPGLRRRAHCIPSPLSAPAASRSRQDGGSGRLPRALPAGPGGPNPWGAQHAGQGRRLPRPRFWEGQSAVPGGSGPGACLPVCSQPWGSSPPFCPRGRPGGSRVSVAKGLQGAPFPPAELGPGHVRNRDLRGPGPARGRTHTLALARGSGAGGTIDTPRPG